MSVSFPPSRYSIDQDDTGWRNYVEARKGGTPEVRLDGELIKYVVTADEIDGVVIAYEMPLQIDSGRIVLRTLRGSVRVIWSNTP